MDIKETILLGKTALGIEFGSTRIKAVLIDASANPLASGDYSWENSYVDGLWTYSMDEIIHGLQQCYKSLKSNVKEQYGVSLTTFGSIGISAMMHGYLAFDDQGQLLVPFRTWRNTNTEEAAKKLTEEFQFNIPLRWSISHLYQAILNQEDHVDKIAYFTTLAGFVHWKLTGEKVLGVGDASGMFPIDSKTGMYDAKMMKRFEELTAGSKLTKKIERLLPTILVAGEDAGKLTQEGADLLDPTGELEAGIALCPPEGDAGTGMVATNSIAVRTGNVSAGTSVFAMIVLEKALQKVYPQIDMVTTPVGDAVAMVHCNNCTSDLNDWAELFEQYSEAMGCPADKNKLFTTLYSIALQADADCGGLLSYNYVSGESITGFEEGCPLFVRNQKSSFTLANFMRLQLYSAMATLKIGLDILLKEEGVQVDSILGHGGFFKTPVIGQKVMAAVMNAPVSVMETAGEGGAWGIAILAAYLIGGSEYASFDEYLKKVVFQNNSGSTMQPDAKDVEGFETFMVRYKKGLGIETAAVSALEE